MSKTWDILFINTFNNKWNKGLSITYVYSYNKKRAQSS